MRKLLIPILFLLSLSFTQSPNADDKPLELAQRQAEVAAGKYAIVVGIDEYEDPDIIDLNYCVKDAMSFADTLIEYCGYRRKQVLTLYNEEATLKSIKKKLMMLSGANAPDGADTIIFYYSGHGAFLETNDPQQPGDDYLIPYDGSADPSVVVNYNLPVRQITGSLANSGFRQQMLFLDACRNKLTEGSGQRAAYGGGFSTALAAAEDASGMKILLGTEWGKVSRENADLRQGVFTYFLVEGLRGEATDEMGLVTIGSLESYINRAMFDYSLQHEHEQNPVSRGEGSSDMLLAVSRHPEQSQYPNYAAAVPVSNPDFGTKVPYFELAGLNGGLFSLDDLLEDNMLGVLVFGFPCCEHYPRNLVQLDQYIDGLDENLVGFVNILSRSFRTEDYFRDWYGTLFADNDCTFRVIFGSEEVLGNYGIQRSPTVFVVNQKGDLLAEFNSSDYVPDLQEKVDELLAN